MADQDGRPYRILRFGDRQDITESRPKRSHKNGTISAVSVIVTTDEDGDEDIITSPDNHLPLAAVFPQGLRALIEIARSTGQSFRVVRFSDREDVTDQFAAKGEMASNTDDGRDCLTGARMKRSG